MELASLRRMKISGGFSPTPEQVAIALSAGNMQKLKLHNRLIVESFAGATKTCTLGYIAQSYHISYPKVKILYLAFNSSTKEEGEKTFPRNTKCKTGHGLAFGNVIRHFEGRHTRANTMQIVRAIERFQSIEELLPLADWDRRAAATAVIQTINKFAQSDSDWVMARHVPQRAVQPVEEDKRYEATNQIQLIAQRIWTYLLEPDSKIPITPDYYLKFYALQHPRLPYDLILVDEAQDTNPVVLGLLNDQPASTNIILVGDPHQQIYSFRGAINITQGMEGEKKRLTQSFRFGPEIAYAANVVLEMLGETTPLIGSGKPGQVIDTPEVYDNETVLCRGNAGVIREAISALHRRLKVHIIGGAKAATFLIRAAWELNQGRKPYHDELSVFNKWAEFLEYSETDEGAPYRPIIRMVEEYGSDIPNLCDMLEDEKWVVPEKEADIIVSTVHKAKGMEWKRVVRLCDDFQSLITMDQNGDLVLKREEAHIMYVAMTRASTTLNTMGYLGELELDLEELRQEGLVPGMGAPQQDLPVETGDPTETEVPIVEQPIPEPTVGTGIMYDMALVESKSKLTDAILYLPEGDKFRAQLEQIRDQIVDHIHNG